MEYFFVDDERLREMQEAEQVIEVRSYNTRCGVWTYFTADDGQIDLDAHDYLVIGTLVSYRALREYFGEEKLLPVYIEVEDGLRLQGQWRGNGDRQNQSIRSCAGDSWQTRKIFPRKNWAGQGSRDDLKPGSGCMPGGNRRLYPKVGKGMTLRKYVLY